MTDFGRKAAVHQRLTLSKMPRRNPQSPLGGQFVQVRATPPLTAANIMTEIMTKARIWQKMQ
jgi:hypothetical protein